MPAVNAPLHKPDLKRKLELAVMSKMFVVRKKVHEYLYRKPFPHTVR
jgi:hypothetical protein